MAAIQQRFGVGKKEVDVILDELTADGNHVTRREIKDSIREQDPELS